MKNLLISICLLSLLSCSTDIEVTVPTFGDDSRLGETFPLLQSAKQKMEGVYQVSRGTSHFGNRVILKWSGNHLSIFGLKDANYFIFQGGILDSTLYFEGYWRYATSLETGLARLTISSEDGGDFLINNGDSVQIKLNGAFDDDNETPNNKLVLVYDRPFGEKVYEKNFWSLAHRGGGRTADFLPASENTLEMINLAERYGANAIEIDVKLSHDRIPFLYHDRTINLRLTQKGTMWGNIEDFTFAQLKTHITLINGEKIPSLREALEFVLEETNLTMIWLDMKSTKNDLPEVIPLQQEIMNRAAAMGRNLEIFIGLPTAEKIEQFVSYPSYETVLSLNEFEPVDVRFTDSEIWGPRWTLGTQNNEVQAMHAEGRQVITWTMDDPNFISQYINEGEFDGMVTNYPSLVAYYHYIQF
jgi:glycerophosphoryl diester phosphodiesterase